MENNGRLNSLEKDIANIQVVLNKIDQSVDKLTSISADVTQLLAVREVRANEIEKQVGALNVNVEAMRMLPLMSANHIYDLVERTKKEFVEELEELKKELLTKNEENAKKVSRLERWMWTSMGVASAVALIFGKVASIVAALLH